MDPLWSCLYGLPDQCYLDFVRRYLIQSEESGDIDDPFAIDLPPGISDATFIPPNSITDIRHRGAKIIIGQSGSGKSAIASSLLRQADKSRTAALLRQADRSVLAIELDLRQFGTASVDQNFLAGQTSPLALDLLIPFIFDAYWDKTLISDELREAYLPQLRQEQDWMELLRWFYRNYPPTRLQINDFELMAWLHAAHTGPLGQVSTLTSLNKLAELITWQAPQPRFFGDPPLYPPLSQAYEGVELVIDGLEQLPSASVRRLLNDTQNLYDLGLNSRFWFKLFVDSRWENLAMDMNCVHAGRVSVLRLRPWSESELRRLLRLRLYIFRPDRSTMDTEELPEYDLGHLLADAGALRREAKDKLEEWICTEVDVPAHVLRLARCVVFVCAQKKSNSEPPLGVYDVKNLISQYLEATGRPESEPDFQSEE